MDEAQAMHARRPFLEVRGELLNNNNILHFSSISIVQQVRTSHGSKPSSDECQSTEQSKLILLTVCVRGQSQGEFGACLTLRALVILAQEVDVALEEDFNEAMLAMLRDLPMQDIYQVRKTFGCPCIVASLLVVSGSPAHRRNLPYWASTFKIG